jgi:hypothetical protein
MVLVPGMERRVGNENISGSSPEAHEGEMRYDFAVIGDREAREPPPNVGPPVIDVVDAHG